MAAKKIYRIWYIDVVKEETWWEETPALDRDDAVSRFRTMVERSGRQVRILSIEEDVTPGGPPPQAPPKKTHADDEDGDTPEDMNRGEWWKNGGKPPEDVV